MNSNKSLTDLFSGTTVEIDTVQQYLTQTDLGYVRFVRSQHPINTRALIVAQRMERFESLVREHLTGATVVRGLILTEIRTMFETLGDLAEGSILIVMTTVKKVIDDQEWFELRVRFDPLMTLVITHVNLWCVIINDKHYGRARH